MSQLNQLEKLVKDTLFSLNLKNEKDFYQLKLLNEAISKKIAEAELEFFIESAGNQESNKVADSKHKVH